MINPGKGYLLLKLHSKIEDNHKFSSYSQKKVGPLDLVTDLIQHTVLHHNNKDN